MFSEQPSSVGADDSVEVRPRIGSHLPIMADEICDFMTEGRQIRLLVDGTAGGGGHIAALLDALPEAELLGVDRDPAAAVLVEKRFTGVKRVRVRAASYTGIPSLLDELGLGLPDAVLFDLGFSSIQLDDPDRGFAHGRDGSLDMRYDRSSDDPTAADLVNHLSRSELADIIFKYGEEGRSRRIADEIVRRRPLQTTGQLAEVVSTAVRGHRVKVLSRVFQAIRIAVNRELDELEKLLAGLHSWTAPGCRAAFLTFHSIEDRMVKLFFRDSAEFQITSPPWMVAGQEERRMNSRARSARLRTGVRL